MMAPPALCSRHKSRAVRPGLGLNAEMIETGLPPARRDGEIHARIVEHPFGIVRLDHGRLGREQRRIEADRALQIIDGDVDMQRFMVASFRL